MNPVIKEDIGNIIRDYPEFFSIKGKTILITGATGLIGSLLVYLFGEMNAQIDETDGQVKIIAFVRNKEKAQRLFVDYISCKWFSIKVGSIVDEIPYFSAIDYIIHGAMNTESKSFANNPVETIDNAVGGTKNILELARKSNCQSFIYLSSMEVYGFTQERKVLTENCQEYIDITSPRSSYPMGKRMAEAMCLAYHSEYAVPVKIIRLAQIFGPGISKDDSRVFAYFARCIINRENIVLNTDGSSERMYLYTSDAVSAIMKVLMDGEVGKIYNAANPHTYNSIYEMAKKAQLLCPDKSISIIRNAEINSEIYPQKHCLYLAVEQIYSLGWRPHMAVNEMFKRLIEYWGE